MELPIAEDATLPPRPLRERFTRADASGARPGAAAACFPTLDGLLVTASGGGDLDGSLMGLTLRVLGLVGEDFRFFVVLAGSFIGVHRVPFSTFEGVDTAGRRA